MEMRRFAGALLEATRWLAATVLPVTVAAILSGCAGTMQARTIGAPQEQVVQQVPAVTGTTVRLELLDEYDRPVASVTVSAKDDLGRVSWFEVGSQGWGETVVPGDGTLHGWRLQTGEPRELPACARRSAHRYQCIFIRGGAQ